MAHALRRNRAHLRELVASPAKTVRFSDEPTRPVQIVHSMFLTSQIQKKKLTRNLRRKKQPSVSQALDLGVVSESQFVIRGKLIYELTSFVTSFSN